MALSAVCDTGASKLLISNSLATDLWSDDYMKNLQAAPAFQLIDVNSNFLKVQGITNCEFYMGSSSFKHNFIIFESLKNEILIGNNFFLAHKIAIYPSIGLLYESSNLFNVEILPQQTFEVLITDDISLLPHTNRVVSFKVNMTN